MFLAISIYLTLLDFISCNAINLHFNSAEDPLEAGQACGAAGYILDAPFPDDEHDNQNKTRKRRAATNQPFRVWPQGKIPFQIQGKFSRKAKRLIRKAMNHWENETCVSFVKRTTEEDYLYIYRGQGCCSYVGRRGGKQYLSLGKGCLRFGIITHELGHSVGFWHEQNRPDRSIYIDVIYENVDSSKYLNFDPRSLNEVRTFDQVYDYESIMHYGSRFFTKNGGNTIETKNPGIDTKPGPGNPHTNEIGASYYKYNGPVLSRQDILETNLLYQCTKMTECGGTIFASGGSFTSLNFPNTYPLDIERDCIWIITTIKPEKNQNGVYSSLTVLFDKFNVGNQVDKRTGKCEDDYVEVREGKGFLSPYIVRYCGDISPAPISTMSGSLYVRFHMSGKNANKAAIQPFTGFETSFKTDSCSHRIKDFPAKISTPHFPFAYETESDCIWTIEANKGMQVELDFLFFSLRGLDIQEGCLDYIELHEGDGDSEKFIGRYCGTNNPGKIVSRLSKVKIHFHAAKRKQLGWYMGFQANLQQKDLDECTLGTHDCSQACLNYPGGYYCGCYSGYDTIYKHKSRKAECVDKDECLVNNGGCSHTCINTDGSYICSCPDGYTLTTNKTNCVDVNECSFHEKPCSHFCNNKQGGYECSCTEGHILKSDGKTCIKLPSCTGTFHSPLSTIHSPTIPPSYTKPINCVWDIKVPKHLQLVLSIDLPWGDNNDCHNYLLIHDDVISRKYQLNTRKICHQNDVHEEIVMKKHKAIIDYHAQVPFLPKFTIHYHSILPIQKQCIKTYNTTHGRIHTPGFPYQYSNLEHCEWLIHSPNKKRLKVKFGHFNIEYHTTCEFDYVELEEIYYNMNRIKKIGRFCGQTKPPVIHIDGRTSYLKIIFHSDETMSEKGFKMHFKENAF